MCQVTIYMKDNNDEAILSEVVSLERTDQGWLAQQLFEEPMIIQGQIQRIDFLKHTIVLTKEVP
ncbi:MAG: CooT family nickel-binding protein [Deltaproteobacteria bacterium]|nr:CooT family nickel-binding protein [Deltaproteobacteria bacterium]